MEESFLSCLCGQNYEAEISIAETGKTYKKKGEVGRPIRMRSRLLHSTCFLLFHHPK